MRLLCWFGLHYWAHDTMSMEAYAQRFYFCLRCKVMHFDPPPSNKK